MRAKGRSTMRTKSRPSPGRWPSYHVDAAVNSALASLPIRRGRFTAPQIALEAFPNLGPGLPGINARAGTGRGIELQSFLEELGGTLAHVHESNADDIAQ